MDTQIIDRRGRPLDERDTEIYHRLKERWDAVAGPRVGDFVHFADGVLRRFSYLWDDGAQTSAAGSWSWGGGYMSFSGSLYRPVPLNTLTDTGETKPGSCWFFHHDFQTAGGAVDVTVDCRMYRCSLESPFL